MNIDDVPTTARALLHRLDPAQAAEATGRGAHLVNTRPQHQRQADGEIPGALIIERNHLEWRLDPTSTAHIPEATGPDITWIVFCNEGCSSSLANTAAETPAARRSRRSREHGPGRRDRLATLRSYIPPEQGRPMPSPQASSPALGQLGSRESHSSTAVGTGRRPLLTPSMT